MEKENKIGGLHHLISKLMKTTIIKTVWYCHKDRHVDQWDRVESTELDLHIHGQLIFIKGDKVIQ